MYALAADGLCVEISQCGCFYRGHEVPPGAVVQIQCQRWFVQLRCFIDTMSVQPGHPSRADNADNGTALSALVSLQTVSQLMVTCLILLYLGGSHCLVDCRARASGATAAAAAVS